MKSGSSAMFPSSLGLSLQCGGTGVQLASSFMRHMTFVRLR